MTLPSLPPQLPVSPISSEEKLWVLAAHLSPFLGFPLIIPLVIYLAKKDASAFIGENAREALNFHLTLFLISAITLPFILFSVIVCFLLAFLAIPFYLAIAVASFIFSILAAIRSSEGQVYRYPITLRLI